MPESLKGEQMAKPKRGTLTDAMDRMERARAATESAPRAQGDPAPQSAETPRSHNDDEPFTVANVREARKMIAEEETKATKTKVSLYLDRSLVEQARGAVAWAVMQGGEPESISAMMNAALAAELERLKDVLKPDGGQFPNLARGRKGRPPRA